MDNENNKRFIFEYGRGYIEEIEDYGGTLDFWFCCDEIYVSVDVRRDVSSGFYAPYFTINTKYLKSSENLNLLLLEAYEEHKKTIQLYHEVAVLGKTPVWSYTKEDLETLLSIDLTEEEEKNVEKLLSKFTYIYLIKDLDTGYIKIGRSINPENRLQTLIKQGTMLPKPNNFILLEAWQATKEVETILHQNCADSRVRGEWFDINENLLGHIYTFLSGFPRYFEEKK